MKTVNCIAFPFLVVLLISVVPLSLFGTNLSDNCGTTATAPSQTAFTHTGGRYITSQGTLTSFVLFVRFADDNETSTTWPTPTSLPTWAQNILNPNYSVTGNYTLNSISHYIWENSYGKLHVIGDVYYVTLDHNESYYYSLSDDYTAHSSIQQDALNKLANQIDHFEVDMGKYDNWKRTSEFNNVYTGPGSGQSKDNIVDMCWVVLRNLHDENYTTYGLGLDIAQLYASRTINGVTIQSGYPGSSGSGSGISLFSHNFIDQVGYNTVMRMPASEYDNDGSHYTVIGTMVHELSHWFFGYNHFGTPNLCRAVSYTYSRSSSHTLPYTVNSGAAFGNFLGYEKIRLGWITTSEIQVISSNNSSVNLPDMETTTSGTKIVKIPLDANQSIYLENRSWNSIYEARYVPNNYQKPLKPGVLAYLITYEDDYLSNTPIQQICADGKWTWNIIAGGGTGTVADNDDVLVKATPNSTAGYDEREDIHISGQGSKTWWGLYYPNNMGSNFGRWYKGVNYVDENHNVGDYRGNIKQPFDVGDVISPWSNGATHKWNDSTGQFVATSVGVEVLSFDAPTSTYALSVKTSNPGELSPSKPQAVNASLNSSNEVVVSWAANQEPDLAGYNIYKAVYYSGSGLTYTKLNSSPLTTTTFTDNSAPPTGLPNNVDVYYRYQVKALDNTGKASIVSDDYWYYLGRTASGSITTNITWPGLFFLIGNVTVSNNATLTISSGATIGNISNITVQTGATLVINSGATLKFNSATNIYDEGSPKGSLSINGKIHADGATFTSNNAGPNYYWAAIYISYSNPGGDGNYIRNCTISKCKFGMTIYNSRFDGASDEIYNNTFTRCLNPIRLTGNSYVKRITYNNLVDNLEDGIVIYSSTAPTVSHNTIQKSNSTYSGRDGFWIYGASSQPFMTTNAISYGSQDGLRCEYYASPYLGGQDSYGSPVPGGNYIHNNARYGVYAPPNTSPYLGESFGGLCTVLGGYNTIYSNTVYQLYGAGNYVLAQANLWGVDPDLGCWDFTSGTKQTLFGDPDFQWVYPALRDLSCEEGLIAGGTNENAKVVNSLSKKETILPEKILLTLGDQLVMGRLFEQAIAVYDSLIGLYPNSIEAEIALTRTHYAILNFNADMEKKLNTARMKNAAQYFVAISSLNNGKKLERMSLELAAINAGLQGDIKSAILRNEIIAKRWPNSESEKHALASLVELYLQAGDTKRGKENLKALQSKYPDDAVTQLIADIVRMLDQYKALAAGNTKLSSLPSSISKSTTNIPQSNDNLVPKETALYQCYPNPFNPTTNISYSLSAAGMVELTVFDVLGRKVSELVHEYESEGNKAVQFDGTALPSGIYFVRLNTSGKEFTQRFLLLK